MATRLIEIDVGVTSNGARIAPIELRGTVEMLGINGGVKAAGVDLDKSEYKTQP